MYSAKMGPDQATSLKMERINGWPDNGCLPDDLNSQFVCTDVEHLQGFPDAKTIVQQKFIASSGRFGQDGFLEKVAIRGLQLRDCDREILQLYGDQG